MGRVQISLTNGEVVAFADSRDIDQLLADIAANGYLRITGERTVLGSQSLTMEGDYVVFAAHILSMFV